MVLPKGDGGKYGKVGWRQFTTLEKAIEAYTKLDWNYNDGTFTYLWITYQAERNRCILETWQLKQIVHRCGSVHTFAQFGSCGVNITCPKCGSTRTINQSEECTLIDSKIIPLQKAWEILAKTHQIVLGLPESILPNNQQSIFDR